MRLRLAWLAALLCFGCHSLVQSSRDARQPEPAAAPSQPDAPRQPAVPPSDLRLAAECMEKGDDRGACEHLGVYLSAHPGHRNARFYHAELLLKLGRPQEARAEYERAVEYAQDEPRRDLRHLVHCHGRLMELGEQASDDYATNLHRGIGMALLAEEHAAIEDPDGELSTEGLLCKAASSLAAARALRPAEARPCWYLFLVWRQLAQHQQAQRWLYRAAEAAPYSRLTPGEQRGFQLACRSFTRPGEP